MMCINYTLGFQLSASANEGDLFQHRADVEHLLVLATTETLGASGSWAPWGVWMTYQVAIKNADVSGNLDGTATD